MIEDKDFITFLSSRGLDTDTVMKAFRQARKSHRHHRRFSGKREFNAHILVVTQELIYSFGSKKPSEYLVGAALLHDVMEDDPKMTHKKFQDKFPQQIYEIVEALSKKPEDNHPNLSEKEINAVNKKVVAELRRRSKDIQLVKLADRYSNIADLEDIKHTHPDVYERYVSETKELFLPFASEVSEYFYKKMKSKLEELG